MDTTSKNRLITKFPLLIDESPIEQKSINWLGTDPELRQHVGLINRCFEVMQTLLTLNKPWSEDEFTLIRLGGRLFNSAGSGLKCARSGYYQPAFAMTRDLLETSFLLDYFKLHPDRITVWREADDKTLNKRFKPSEIRKALAAVETFKAPRRELYAWYCEKAAHPSPQAIELITTLDGLKIGPFSDLERLTLFVRDLALRFSAATMTFAKHFLAHSADTLDIQVQFYRTLRDWYQIYIPELHSELRDELNKIENTIKS